MNVKTSRGRANRPYHHGALRQALIDAAIELLSEGDASAVSLREVARRASVSPGAPYHHFADKDALLAAVAVEGFRLLGERTLAVMAGYTTLGEAELETLLRGYVQFAQEHPGHFQVMFRPELHEGMYPELDEAGHRSFELLSGVLENAGLPKQEAVELAAVCFAEAHGLANLAEKHGLWEMVGTSGLDRVIARAARLLAAALVEAKRSARRSR